MKTAALLFSLPLLAAQTAPVQRISTSGWCSPVFVNVSGPVTVNCIGVDPQANREMNRQLDSLKLGYKEKVRQANEWARKYKLLQKELDRESDGSALARLAEQALHAGDLDRAIALLKQLAGGPDKQNVDRAAAHAYELGLALELKFQTPEALTYLEQAQRYRPENTTYAAEYARALLKENRFAESEAIFTKTIARLEELRKKDYLTYAVPLMQAEMEVGTLYANTDRLDKAGDAYNSAFATCLTVGMFSNACSYADLTDILSELGGLLIRGERYQEAKGIYEQAFQQYKSVSKDGTAYMPEQARCLSYLGLIYQHLNEPAKAERALQMALSIQVLLLDQKKPANRADLAQTYLMDADFKSETNRLEKAESDFSSAAEILRELAHEDAEAYQPSLERALYSWGRVDLLAKKYREASTVYEELLPIAQELATRDPARYLEDVAVSWNSLATIRSDARQYAECLKFRQQAAEAFRKLAALNHAQLASLAATLTAVAWDALVMQDADLAQRSADESEQILRDFHRRDPAAYGEKFGQSLVIEAMVLKYRHADCADVKRKAAEATQVTSAPGVTSAAQVFIDACR